MITIKQIRGGREYLGRHLSANDYYSESETVVGHWRGKLAKKLGIEGREVNRKDFESLRCNLHPQTGEKLRQRSAKVAYHDVVVSAPKSYSIAALVGGDERLVEGFDRAVAKAFKRLEKSTHVRNRSGQAYHTEATIQTGNAAAAVFRHDTSRLLEPQLHTHLVFSNHSWCEKRLGYFALQPKIMMEESKRWITDQFHRDLAKEARQAGYRVELQDNRMRLLDVGLKLERKFSTRARQRRAFERRYQKLFGRSPNKKRIEQFIKEGKTAAKRRFADEYRIKFREAPSKQKLDGFVKDWRSAKMATSTRIEVYQIQREKLTHLDAERLDGMVFQARAKRHDLKDHAEEKLENQNLPIAELDDATKHENKKHFATRGKKHPANQRKQQQKEQYEKAVGRMEAIRRMRRGMALAQALRGHPMVFMIQQLSTLTRKMK